MYASKLRRETTLEKFSNRFSDPDYENYSDDFASDHDETLQEEVKSAMAEGDPEKLKTAAANAVAAVKKSDPAGSTPSKCNIGVNNCFTEYTGSTELSGKNANIIAEYLAGSKNFTVIDVSEVQAAANAGDLVIGAAKNDKGSGHVVIAVPGTAAMTGTWNGKKASEIGGIPMVMDTGYNKRTTSQSVNYSWGKDKQADVIFYKYTPVK